MIQRPRPLGLLLCDQVIFEGGTNKPSLIGVFTGIGCSRFPSLPRRIDLFAALTDGQGEGEFTVRVVHMNTDEQVASRTMTIDFPDPLKVVNFRCRLENLSFAKSGTYLFELLAEDEIVCHQRIEVYLREEQA